MLPSADNYYMVKVKLTHIDILPCSVLLLCCFHLSQTDTLCLSHTPWGYMCVGSVCKLWQRWDRQLRSTGSWVTCFHDNHFSLAPGPKNAFCSLCFSFAYSLCPSVSLFVCLFSSHAFFFISLILGLNCLALTRLYCSPREQIFFSFMGNIRDKQRNMLKAFRKLQ